MSCTNNKPKHLVAYLPATVKGTSHFNDIIKQFFNTETHNSLEFKIRSRIFSDYISNKYRTIFITDGNL